MIREELQTEIGPVVCFRSAVQSAQWSASRAGVAVYKSGIAYYGGREPGWQFWPPNRVHEITNPTEAARLAIAAHYRLIDDAYSGAAE